MMCDWLTDVQLGIDLVVLEVTYEMAVDAGLQVDEYGIEQCVCVCVCVCVCDILQEIISSCSMMPFTTEGCSYIILGCICW